MQVFKRIIHVVIIAALAGFLGYKVGIKKYEINLRGCETTADDLADQLHDSESKRIYCMQILEQTWKAIFPDADVKVK